MSLFAALTAAAPWLGAFAFLAVIGRAAGSHKVAEANRAALLTWCRVIGGDDPSPPPSIPPRPRQSGRRAR